ncbi:DUF2240 family protein [Candidatus Woesearchaeota archaeon]|nr:DUF2240 family protein [Candidatus Woesearchaeota archaeon]
MIDLPLDKIIERITEETDLTETQVREKISQKLEELSGLISEEGAAHIIANEHDVKLQDPDKPLTIDKLASGMRNLIIKGKARQVFEVREFSNERRSGKVGNFLLQDETGITRVVLWNDQADQLSDIKQGDVIRIQGAYVRENNGRTELHLGSDAKLQVNPEGVTVDVDVTQTSRPPAEIKKITELSEQDGNAVIVATIVQVFDPHFFAVCPECNARAKEEDGKHTCPRHGEVTPTYNYVMNLYLDDSTDNVRCVLWREQIETLLGKSRDELLKMKDEGGAFEDAKTDLLGIVVKARGKVKNNEAFGRLEFVAYELEKDVDPDAAKPAKGKEKPAKQEDKPVESKTTVTATTDEDTGKKSVSVKKEEKVEAEEDELFSLEDIEDLDDLDE